MLCPSNYIGDRKDEFQAPSGAGEAYLKFEQHGERNDGRSWHEAADLECPRIGRY
jgi:hypothetical protein